MEVGLLSEIGGLPAGSTVGSTLFVPVDWCGLAGLCAWRAWYWDGDGRFD